MIRPSVANKSNGWPDIVFLVLFSISASRPLSHKAIFRFYLPQSAVQLLPSLVKPITSLSLLIVIRPVPELPVLTIVLASFFSNSTLVRSGMPSENLKSYLLPTLVTKTLPLSCVMFFSLSVYPIFPLKVPANISLSAGSVSLLHDVKNTVASNNKPDMLRIAFIKIVLVTG